MKNIKKIALGTLTGIFLTLGQAYGVNLDIITGFSGNLTGGASGKIYYPITSDTSVILGASSTISTTASKGSDVNIIAGITAIPPVLGNIDLYTVWGNPTGTGIGSGTTTSGASDAFMLTDVVVSKQWMYKLTEKINVGISLVLLDITMGTPIYSAKIGILPKMYPVFGGSIAF